MALFDNFPYSNFHDLNLDWMIKIMKDLETAWETTQGEWNSTEEFIQNYFNNLDVQTEINEKISAMVEDGTFTSALIPALMGTIPPLFVDTLEEMTNHLRLYVYKTDYNVYAWDGKKFRKTGIPYVSNMANYLSAWQTAPDEFDFDGVASNAVYLLANGNYKNTPIQTGYICTFANPSVRMQMAIQLSSQRIYTRQFTSGTWKDWNANILQNMGALPSGDLDAISAENGFYILDSGHSYTHSPVSAGLLLHLEVGVKTQLVWDFVSGQQYYRRYTSKWFPWTNVSVPDDPNLALECWSIDADKAASYNHKLAALPRNTYSWVLWSWFEDHPPMPDMSDFPYWIITLGPSGTRAATSAAGTQLIVQPFPKGKVFMRSIISGAYRPWQDLTPDITGNGKYIAFGDSLTWGAIWKPGAGGSGHVITRADPEDRLPDCIAVATRCSDFHNEGVSGQGIIEPTEGQSGLQKIKTTNYDGVDLITIMYGRNDSHLPLGSWEFSNPDDGTICGAFYSALAYLAEHAPKAQVIVISPAPSTAHNDEVFTQTWSGGWSLSDFERELKIICEEFNIPFISWRGCHYIKSWASFTGTDSNYAHPNDTTCYRTMGAFLAGRVASYFTFNHK